MSNIIENFFWNSTKFNYNFIEIQYNIQKITKYNSYYDYLD